MVMGTYRGSAGGGVGLPGPPGPQGPPGPAGPADVSGTALSVLTRAVLPPPPPYPIGLWQPLDFNVREVDTHGALQVGANWQWFAPMKGTYHLYAALCLEPLAGAPVWAMRVMRMGMEEAYAEFAGYTGQISWLGHLMAGEVLQVQIKANGPTPTQIRNGPPRSSIVIAGCGVMP